MIYDGSAHCSKVVQICVNISFWFRKIVAVWSTVQAGCETGDCPNGASSSL